MGRPKITILSATDDFKVSKPAPVSVLVNRADYLEALEVAEKYIEELRPHRKNQKNLDRALAIIKVIRFNAMLSYGFRQQTFATLNEILDDIYVELNE